VAEDLAHVLLFQAAIFRRPRKLLLELLCRQTRFDGNLSQQGEIADGGAVANPTVILSEGEVEHPVQAVFDGPVPGEWP
jgi:hypothetical protein